MKKMRQQQGVPLTLALMFVLLFSVSCALRESSGKMGITGTSEGPKPGNVDTVDLGGGVKMELVWVPSGSFQMGSSKPEQDKAVKDGARREWVSNEGPVHTVELDGYWMGKFEVTQEQYEAVTGSNPSDFKGPKNPVEMVSWNDAVEFCKSLSRKTGRTFRLPTEAEGECACRAGSSTRFCFGDSDGGLGDYAWYDGNSGNQTHPVGEKKPNAWGLYDMHGNVWEWCRDCYGNYNAGSAKNPQGPSSGGSRVLRGGSWRYSDPNTCRSARRAADLPTHSNNLRGFRVVAVLSSL